MTDEIVKKESLNPAQLLTLAVDKDLDIDKLRQLMELQKSWQADQARVAFFESLADFQIKCPELRKTKQVKFDTTKGNTDYHYAPLADIDRQIKQPLRDCGLTKRWEIQDDKETIRVTCLITHTQGHTERTTMSASPDVSGSKNAIQARGSAIEYMKRYTLIGALGISTADQDIDGRFTEKTVDELHGEYMKEYNQVILLDKTLTKWDPDNWQVDRTPQNYVKAIGSIRKKLFELQQKAK